MKNKYKSAFNFVTNHVPSRNNGFSSTLVENYKILNEGFEKLERIEKIEEELGLDLITLLKAISNEQGIWKKDFETNDFVNRRAMLTCEFGKWRIYDKEWIYELKDYGKTWAITREELENE